MKKLLLFLLVCTLSTAAMAQKKPAFSTAKLTAFLTKYNSVTREKLIEAKTQYITKDIDHDGINEIIVMQHNFVIFIISNAGGKLDTLFERTSPDERIYISDDGFIVVEMEKSYINSKYIIKLKNSKIAETASMSIEHIQTTNEDGEVEYDENIEKTDNYDTLQPKTELTYTYNLEGWKPLIVVSKKTIRR